MDRSGPLMAAESGPGADCWGVGERFPLLEQREVRL